MTITDAVQDLLFPFPAGHDDNNYCDQSKTSNCSQPSDQRVIRGLGSGGIGYKYTYFSIVYLEWTKQFVDRWNQKVNNLYLFHAIIVIHDSPQITNWISIGCKFHVVTASIV